MAIRIFTDATCDLPASYALKRDLTILPMTVSLNGREFAYTGDPAADGIDIKTYYDALRAGGSSTTAQVNVQLYLDAFTAAVKDGDECVYLAFSSGLSGSYQASCLARSQMEAELSARVHIIDTLCASLGQGLLVHLALDKRDSGASAEEIIAYVGDLRLRLHHWFTVEDLMFLKRGGRVSGAAAVVGTMLAIKPVLHMDDEGHLIPVSKVQGRKRALKALVDKMLELAPDAKEYPIFISHGDCEQDAKIVADLVKKQTGADVYMTDFISPVIGAHSGPGTVALFFIADKPGRG